jgi:pimeloyl-ACP methyl ester carboxylesterase
MPAIKPETANAETANAVEPVSVHDRHVPGPQGRLFVRIWSPARPATRAPLVLLHDSLGSVELWRSFPAALCRQTGRQIVAYDRLGFGQSDLHPGTLTPDFIADEAQTGFAAVRRELGIGRFAVFGHSVGGGMAVHCAARHGEDCVALMTESAQAFVEQRTVQGIELARELFRDPDQIARLRKYHGDKARWVLAAWIDSWLNPGFASWSLRPVLPLLRCPALAIHGIDDEYGTSRHPELIGELAGGPTELELMPDTCHVPHREREAAVVARVGRFLLALD